jgi:Domain of unknown function (DUF5624)
MMAYAPHADFKSLYDAYTGPDSTGQHLTKYMVRLTEREPILIITGADFVIFPGSGRDPIVESFRNSTRGFVELTAISHLGAAIAWIFRLRELGYPTWRDDANRLIERMERIHAINDDSYWTDVVAVEAFKGYESKIVDLIDYTCEVSKTYLRACLADESVMTHENLRKHYLDPVNSAEIPIPINDVMVATFTLTYLDIAHRMLGWLRAQNFDWQNLMVLVSGRAGRPSSGLTWATNNNCHLIWRASFEQLNPENVQITPHGPSLALADMGNKARLTEAEGQFRDIFLHLRANIDMSRIMFEGYPSFSKSIEEPPVIEPKTKTLRAMPRLRSPDDRLTAITRLRFVMEDPTQMLSNSVAHFVTDQLAEHGNRPEAVVIPGFSNITYPRRKV